MIAALRLAALPLAATLAVDPSGLAMSSGGSLEPMALFATGAVEGWKRLSLAETVPYVSEALTSELLFATRSPAGSYVFLTRTDNTLRRPAPQLDTLQSFFSEGAFKDLAPEGFTTRAAAIRGPQGETLEALVCDFTTRRLSYPVGPDASPGGPVHVKAVILPLVLWDETAQRYQNLLYAADFRGRPDAIADLALFDALWREVSLPGSGWSVVPAHRFNALRPELAEETGGRATPAPPLGAQPAAISGAAELSVTIHRLARGEISGLPSDRPRSLAGTVVGAVLDRLRRDALRANERQIWQEAFDRAPERLRGRIAAVFLAESLALGERDFARKIARDAFDSIGSIGALECAEWRTLIEGLRRNPDAASWRDPELETFFRWRDEPTCPDLSALLADLGLLEDPVDLQADGSHSLLDLLDGP